MHTPNTPQSTLPRDTTALDHLLPSPERTAPQRKPAAPLANGQTRFTGEELSRMVAEAAYFRAQQRGFISGHEVDDWLDAEQEMLAKLLSAPQP